MSQTVEFLYLKQEEVIDLGIGMEEIVNTVDEVFSLYDKGDINLPDKVVLDLGEKERGRINGLPAYVGGDYDVCGMKWIPSFPNNPEKYGLPRANGLTVLNNSWTGMPLAIMDGTWISAMRTGAVTGVGARYLAREDAKSAAMIGCGVQAIIQIIALDEVLDLEKVKVYDIKKEAAIRLKEEIAKKLSLEVEIADSPEEAVVGSDIIVTATVADESIVKESWLKEGAFFSHVGSYQEEEYEVVQSADKIVVDDWHQVLHRGTPVLAKMFKEDLITEDDIHANLGEIVNGKKSGREIETENIFFQPMGMGSEDVAVAYKIYEKAKTKEIGKNLKLWEEPKYV